MCVFETSGVRFRTVTRSAHPGKNHLDSDDNYRPPFLTCDRHRRYCLSCGFCAFRALFYHERQQKKIKGIRKAALLPGLEGKSIPDFQEKSAVGLG